MKKPAPKTTSENQLDQQPEKQNDKPGILSNSPVWTTLAPRPAGSAQGFQEAWYLKLNDPDHQRALWIRMTLHCSSNGFRRVAETWALMFQRTENREISKTALKQTHDIRDFSVLRDRHGDESGIRIGDCELTDTGSRGVIHSKGRTIRWDLSFQPAHTASFSLIPESLAKLGLVKNRVGTLHEDLRFTGTVEIDGQKQEWTAAPGMQGHLSGPRNGHSWVWGHCNSFVDEQGKPASFVFEGLSGRASVSGPMRTPQLSSFFFLYQDRAYRFNSFWDAIRTRSQHSLTEWTFQADRGELSFRGHAKAEHRDFAGLVYEDTDGSLLYSNNSKLSDLTILVYRAGKLESTFKAPGTAAFEVVSRLKNPYVPTLL